jgi:integrase
MKNVIKNQPQFGEKKAYNPESILGRANALLIDLKRVQKKEISRTVGQNELSNSQTQQNQGEESRTTPILKNPVSVAPPQFENSTFENLLHRTETEEAGLFANCTGKPNLNLTTIKPAANVRIVARDVVAKIKTFSAEELLILQANIFKTFPNLPTFQRRAKHLELNIIFSLYQGCSLERKDILRLEMNKINFKRQTIKIDRNYETQPINTDLSEALYNYIHNFRIKLELNHDRLFFSSEPMLEKALQELQRVCENEQINSKPLNLHTLCHSIAAANLQPA